MIALTEQERRILSLVTPVAESLGMEIVASHQSSRRPEGPSSTRSMEWQFCANRAELSSSTL
ncbi:MAG: hypothetical protein ACPH9E_14985, partial [Hyphomonas sp.]